MALPNQYPSSHPRVQVESTGWSRDQSLGRKVRLGELGRGGGGGRSLAGAGGELEPPL